jgi:hypothetical protein
MIEGIDYIYITPASDPESVHIKFTDGEYKDTVFKFGNVKFEEKDDQGYLHFAYDVIQSPIMKPRKLEKNEDFKNYIGNLLIEIISGNLEQEIIDESGTTDTEESDSQ